MTNEPRKKAKLPRKSKSNFKQIFNWILAVLVVFVAVFYSISSKFDPKESALIPSTFNLTLPKYWHVCSSNWNSNGHLRTLDRVFDRLGFAFVNASNGDDWDVLWGFEYPFDGNYPLFSPLFENDWKEHQRINHIPGNGHITSKRKMTTENRDLKFIMPTFDNREDFDKYVKENPTKKFVQKNVYDRGVQVIEKENINFDDPTTIYQVFMDKPMLIDERAFDMGVYALISSINPLRVHRYESEILMRFCPEPYYPFNESNVDQYVIYESHQQYDELPSFEKYNSHFGYSLKHIFEDYLEEKGYDPAKLWSQVDEIMATVISRTERKFMRWIDEMEIKSTRHFFELVRFDFIIDADFNVYLMEINMSPNITPESPKFEKNAVLREKMVNELLNLVGAGNYFDIMTRYNSTRMKLVANPSDVSVKMEDCIKHDCANSCEKSECELCFNCLNDDQIAELYEAYREHSKRGGFKRVFPSKNHPTAENLTEKSQFIAKWLAAKCEIDEDWC